MSVYMIGSPLVGEPIKIGTAKDVRKRLSQLQTGSPKRLVILWENDDYGPEEEKMMHTFFKKCRLEGEWFNIPYWELERLQDIFGGISYIGECYWVVCSDSECKEEWCSR